VNDVEALDFRRARLELLDTWQARILGHARGMMGAVVLSVLAHNFDDAMPVLLRAVDPGFIEPTLPCLVSAAKVAKTGHIMADVVMKDGGIIKNCVIFRNERQMKRMFRKLADDLKLDDHDRTQMFIAVRRWVVCDFRLDPNMNPQDPDAKRLRVN